MYVKKCIDIKLVRLNETEEGDPIVMVEACEKQFNITIFDCEKIDVTFYSHYIVWPIIALLVATGLVFCCFLFNSIEEEEDDKTKEQ